LGPGKEAERRPDAPNDNAAKRRDEDDAAN